MKISDLPVLTDAKGNAYIPVVDPDETDPALQNKRIYLSTLSAAAGNFEPYDPANAEYNSTAPSYVSYNNNVYQYINATSTAGKTPATQPLYWRLVTAGQFAHQQNTDTGTNSDAYFIGNPQGQDQEGYRLLGYRVNAAGRKVAHGLHFDESVAPAVYEMVICYDYTGTGSDVWEQFGAYSEATAEEAGLMSSNLYIKAHALPARNSTTIEIVTAPVMSLNGSNILSSTAGSVKVGATTYTVAANTNISGGSIAAHIGKYFFGYIMDSGGTYTTNFVVFNTINDLWDVVPFEGIAYFGLYYYEASGVIKEAPYNFANRVKMPDGSFRVIRGDGLLDLSSIGGIVYKTGTIVDFAAMETEFGAEGTPVAGSITVSYSGATVGHMAFMIHNNGTEPTMAGLAIGDNSGVFHKLSGSGDYVLGVNNYIIFDYRSATQINYTISQ